MRVCELVGLLVSASFSMRECGSKLNCLRECGSKLNCMYCESVIVFTPQPARMSNKFYNQSVCTDY